MATTSGSSSTTRRRVRVPAPTGYGGLPCAARKRWNSSRSMRRGPPGVRDARRAPLRIHRRGGGGGGPRWGPARRGGGGGRGAGTAGFIFFAFFFLLVGAVKT